MGKKTLSADEAKAESTGKELQKAKKQEKLAVAKHSDTKQAVAKAKKTLSAEEAKAGPKGEHDASTFFTKKQLQEMDKKRKLAVAQQANAERTAVKEAKKTAVTEKKVAEAQAKIANDEVKKDKQKIAREVKDVKKKVKAKLNDGNDTKKQKAAFAAEEKADNKLRQTVMKH